MGGGTRRVAAAAGHRPAAAGGGRRRRLRRRRRLLRRRRQLRRRRRVGRLVSEDEPMTDIARSRFWRHLVDRPRRRAARVPDGGAGAHRGGDRRGRDAVIAGRCASPSSRRCRSPACCAACAPRERALEVFGAAARSGTPRRTAASSSTCCSPTATSRSSPTAASTRRSATRRGRRSAGRWRRRFATAASPKASKPGIAEINALLAQHYPREGARGGNELSDRPVISVAAAASACVSARRAGLRRAPRRGDRRR